MQSILVALLGLLTLAVCMLMLSQGLSRKVDLFSMRNLYLVSFLVYQVISPAFVLYADYYPMFDINAPERAAQTLTMYCYVYTFVFFLSYHRLSFSSWFSKKFNSTPRTIDDMLFLGLAVGLIILAIALRVFGPGIPVVSRAAVQIGIAAAAVASAIAGWVWGGRRFNPLIIVMMAFIVGSSLIIGMQGVFGRRPLLSVLLGLAWGYYHRRAKDIPPLKLIVSVAPIVLFVVLAVSAFTAIRESGKTSSASVSETVTKMSQAKVSAGAENIVTGQTCGAAALWCIENFPKNFEPRFLHTLKVFVCWYIPSDFWPEKPIPISLDLARMARVDGVNRSKITLPPGVIGYAAAEGGWIAVIIYALFYGQYIRFFDELIRNNPNNVFLILPVGCATGQVLGLARGDIAIFANLMIMAFLATYVMMYIANKLFGRDDVSAYWQSRVRASYY